MIVHTNYTLLVQGGPSMMWVLKFGHSEKRTKFEKMFHINLTLLSKVKSKILSENLGKTAVLPVLPVITPLPC